MTGLHNAPPTLSALMLANRPAFERECAARHAFNRDRWLRDRRLPPLNRLVDRLFQVSQGAARGNSGGGN